ncbi:Hypothetical predicted protein [Octopus vulgaris]|uniref:Uncharacterized protein n=1 Tax=Octopus vulgaris TaxID=6645 RepID=A0AA36B2Y8_OCTVU|nr:Hypothetical predicted protein [Octopus vulgaris]
MKENSNRDLQTITENELQNEIQTRIMFEMVHATIVIGSIRKRIITLCCEEIVASLPIYGIRRTTRV